MVNNEKRDFLTLIMFLVSFAFLLIYFTSINANGDGITQLTIIKGICQTEGLVDHIPHRLMDVKAGQPIYMPVPYPETFHVMLSPLYNIGGSSAVRLMICLLGAVLAVYVYLLLRNASKTAGVLSAFLTLAVLVLCAGFKVWPLMEQALIVTMVISTYHYYMFWKTKKNVHLVLAAIFLGLSVSIKLEGLLLLGAIMLHATLTIAYDLVKSKQVAALRPLILLLVISAIIYSGPLFEQVHRNGTIDSVPSSYDLPLMHPKYAVDAEAEAEFNEYFPSYSPSYHSPWNVIKAYYSIFFDIPSKAYPPPTVMHIIRSLLMILGPLLCAIGILYLMKRDRLLLSVIFLILLVDMVSVGLTQTVVYRYHCLGIAVLGILMTLGIVGVNRLGKRLPHAGFVATSISCVLVALLLAFYGFLLPSSYGDSGRSDSLIENGYKDMAMWVDTNTPEDSVFLAAEEEFAYFSHRDALWHNLGGAAKTHIIVRTQDEQEALYWLQYYNVTYVLVDSRQWSFYGLGDFMPSDGLMSYIDNSSHFEKIHSVYAGEDRLLLYQVIYD